MHARIDGGESAVDTVVGVGERDVHVLRFCRVCGEPSVHRQINGAVRARQGTGSQQANDYSYLERVQVKGSSQEE